MKQPQLRGSTHCRPGPPASTQPPFFGGAGLGPRIWSAVNPEVLGQAPPPKTFSHVPTALLTVDSLQIGCRAGVRIQLLSGGLGLLCVLISLLS